MEGSFEPPELGSEHEASVPADTPGSVDAANGTGRGGAGWLGRSLMGLFVLLVIAIIVASFVQIPYYAITPGAAIRVSQMITLPSKYRYSVKGGVYMTDVDLVPLRAIQYPFYRWNHDDQVVPSAELTGPATSAQYDEQGIIDMVDARQAATVVALSTLGYHVRAVPDGVVVYEPYPATPASEHLAVGDVITSINGTATPTLTRLHQVLGGLKPGEVVKLAVHSFDVPITKVHGSAIQHLSVTLGRWRVHDGALACVPSGVTTKLPPAPARYAPECLGFYPYQAYRTVGLPFSVTIDSEGIIGPSAGLAFTLGLLDELDHGKLTGGQKVAATGTMSVTGAVGDVSGVAQKTVAVRRAGARVFFVPPPELNVAEAHAGPHLRIVAVSTLSQAVHYLERHGGSLPAPAKRA